jgi:hypothetical protein
MPSIVTGTKEEQQVRVEIERGRTMVKRKRIRIGEFWFVSTWLIVLN